MSDRVSHKKCAPRLNGLTVGVDASRNRSGGAKAHLIGLLSNGDPRDYGIQKVHLWAYKALLDLVPDQPWLIKHNSQSLERSIVEQIIWQAFRLRTEAKRLGCDIFLNTDAGTLGFFSPSVTMSRDMLSYESGEIERYGWGKARARLFLLRYLQSWALRRADAAIFLTNYAATVIQSHCGNLKRFALIPHGVGEDFRGVRHSLEWPADSERPIRILYISNTAWYKHQWHVVRAVELLREAGYDIVLDLVGGGSGPAQAKLMRQIALSDPCAEYVTQHQFVPHNQLQRFLASSDIFVFASSCENMPNTLVEAMATGIPIACSNRGPMPEVLQDGGEYFDPEDSDSIFTALCRLIENSPLREGLARRAKELASEYSWGRCSEETWSFLVKTHSLIDD